MSQAGAYVAVDVTTQVQAWMTGPATNNGVALTAGSAAVQFDSKENDLTGMRRCWMWLRWSRGDRAGGRDHRGLRDRREIRVLLDRLGRKGLRELRD